jgi:hypothetical protein
MTNAERHARDAARRARRWLLFLGIVSLVSFVGFVLAVRHPDPQQLADPAERDLYEMRGVLVLLFGVTTAVRLGTAIGVGRLRPWAWWTAASFEGLSFVAAVVVIALNPGIETVSAAVTPYWVFRRLFDRRLVRWFNPGPGPRQATGPDPRFTWDPEVPLPPGGRVWEGYQAGG